MTTLESLRALRRGNALRLFWLVTDQAIYAGSNFITNVIFARWLSATDYGLYSVSFSGFLFLNVLHYGAFLEPLLIQSAQVGEQHRRAYVVAMGRVHAAMLAAVSAVSGLGFAVAMRLGVPDAAWAILGAGIGGTMVLVLITARRLCLVFLSAFTSAAIGTLYFVGVLATAFLLHWARDIFWAELWAIMGGWSLLCSLIIFGMLYRNTSGTEAYSLRDLYRFQRRYAGWSITSSLCIWVRFEGILLILARLAGLEAVAQTRAVLNLGNPLVQVINAMHASWLVLFSTAHSEGRTQRVLGMAAIYSAAVGVAVVILWVVATPLVSLLYAGKYTEYAWQVPLYYLGLGFLGVDHMISSAFKARGLLTQGYVSQVSSAAIGLTAGLILIPIFGQPGAIYAILTMYVGAASLVAALMWRHSR
ncbi:MAG: lipopolysaccharide biosynthesis protein [Acetobacteraceae bacterium]|nr:lipopolysaccharide biosynthesis protein [Acetobacteraceae bacterium]